MASSYNSGEAADTRRQFSDNDKRSAKFLMALEGDQGMHINPVLP